MATMFRNHPRGRAKYLTVRYYPLRNRRFAGQIRFLPVKFWTGWVTRGYPDPLLTLTYLSASKSADEIKRELQANAITSELPIRASQFQYMNRMVLSKWSPGGWYVACCKAAPNSARFSRLSRNRAYRSSALQSNLYSPKRPTQVRTRM